MADRKNEILSVARQLIREYGYDGFSYKDLSDIIGITKASIHYHFPSKEALGIAVLDSIYKELDYAREMIEEIDSAQLQLETFIKAYFELLDKDLICPISSMHISWNRIPDELKTRLQQVTAYEIERLQAIIELGQSQGEFNKKVSSNLQALTIMSALKGSIQYSRVLGKGYEKDIMNHILDQLS